MEIFFDHEKLNLYQRSLDFVELANDILESIPKRIAAYDQLDRASTSIPHNVAEGNGKFTPKDRCKFLDIAHGSAVECAACLDVLHRKKLIEEEVAIAGKRILVDVVSMLFGLIKRVDPGRVYEEQAAYGPMTFGEAGMREYEDE